MAFKMAGFNPGKGTGMSTAFAKKQAAFKQSARVQFNPNTRDDPDRSNWSEYEKRYFDKHGMHPFEAGEGISGPGKEIDIHASKTIGGVGSDLWTKEDIANEEMFNDLHKRLVDRKKDPLSLDINLDDDGNFKQPSYGDFTNCK